MFIKVQVTNLNLKSQKQRLLLVCTEGEEGKLERRESGVLAKINIREHSNTMSLNDKHSKSIKVKMVMLRICFVLFCGVVVSDVDSIR